jgi:hypothetical protein
MLPTILLVIVVPVIAVLAWMLWKRFASDRLQIFSDRRRGSSQLVSRGEFVDGSLHLPVALALTDQAFYYENSDMQASLERQWIQEVEYDDELSTGQSVGDNTVLRLRCFSQTFEFVLPADTVRQWRSFLPPHRMSGVEPILTPVSSVSGG